MAPTTRHYIPGHIWHAPVKQNKKKFNEINNAPMPEGRISFKISERSAQMDWVATFELPEVITPYGKAKNLDSGNTFLLNQPTDRFRIYRPPAALIGQFLYENWLIKTEILVVLRAFYWFFYMLRWPDLRLCVLKLISAWERWRNEPE